MAVQYSDAAPIVSVQVWYRAGSKDEPRDRRGTAHMFEHLMFDGTSHVRPGVHQQSLTALGGFGNASTDEDATHYLDTLPAADLDYAIRLEADRMRNLAFRKPSLDAAREVVKNELRQQDAAPFAAGLSRCLAVEYLRHPYAWTAAGVAKDLDQVSLDDLKKYYDAYYQPNNALLVVVGKVTAADVKASAERWFGGIAKAADPPRPSAGVDEPAQTTQRRAAVESAQIGMTLIAWHIPAAKDKDIPALQLASIVLGAGDGARLKQRLKLPDPKTKRPIALEAGMDVLVRAEPGVAIALGAYLEPAQAVASETAIFEEVAKLAAQGPAIEELRRAKNQLQSGFTFSLESAQGLAEAIGRSWILTGNPADYAHQIDDIEKVTSADVIRVAKQYLAADRATVVIIPPKAR